MKRVLKWSVPVDNDEHLIGQGVIVHVACQTDPAVVQVWTEETGDEPPTRRARVYGTGQEIPSGAAHIGSTVAAVGPFTLVWHVYGEEPKR